MVTSPIPMNEPEQRPPEPKAPEVDPLTLVVKAFASMKFAFCILAIIAIACFLGTVLPQGEQVAQYLKANPGAAKRMRILGQLGLTSVYTSRWFSHLDQ